MVDTNERFATLDGIRAVAALLVVTIHAQKLFPWLPAHNCIYLAVDLFFCLSGFVIARTYRERLRSDALAPGRFLLSRAMRFYPLYALALLAGFVQWLVLLNPHGMSSFALGFAIVTALAGFLYLPSPLHPRLFPLDSPAWSLASELAVNLLYAMLMRWRSSKGLALTVLISLISLTLYVRKTGDLDGGWRWASISAGIARAALSFSIGAFLERHTRRRRLASNSAAIALVLVVAALLLINPAPDYLLPLVGIAFPAIIFAAAHIEPSGIARAVLLQGGRLSYGVYIIHTPFALLLEHSPAVHWHPKTVGVVFVLAVAVLVWLLERYYVPRARKLMSAIYVARVVPDKLAH